MQELGKPKFFSFSVTKNDSKDYYWLGTALEDIEQHFQNNNIAYGSYILHFLHSN